MQGAPPWDPQRLVTLANWQDPPFNRWGFQHVRDLIPTARIDRGTGSVWRLPREERDLTAVRFTLDGQDWTVGAMLDATWTDGFCVLHRGRLVTERYSNGLTPQGTHLLMSVSKSITSAVAGILVGRGRLDPAALVTQVVPELAGTSFDGATVQHLLDMRTGTRFDEDYANPAADVRVYEQVFLWRPRDPDSGLPDDALSYYATLGNDEPHGGAFRYRSVLTDVLAWVIERAGGARLSDLLSRELWQPMGAEFDAEITVDGRGNPMADGGICATLRDVARFGLLCLRGGVRGRRQIVPGAWLADTLAGAPDGPAAFVQAHDEETRGFPPGAHYRNQWWVWDPAAPSSFASGINGQHIYVHGPTDTVVAKLSTWPAADDPFLWRLTRAGAEAIGQTLAGEGA